MVTYVLDSSALLRYLDNEAGAVRVAEIIKSHLTGKAAAIIAAPHWGEIAGITCKLHGKSAMELVLARLSAFGLQIVPVDGDRAVSAALIKLKTRIPYVDAFGVAVASESHDRVLVTADVDFKAATHDVTIEFLPEK
jgi:predicted nucleic acid-binding protein